MKNLALTLALVTSSVISLFAQLPDPGFTVDENTAIVITDPQNDFLSPNGVAWGVVGESVTANNTVDNIEALFKVAKEKNITVFVSPHYYYKHDHNWEFEGALEALMHKITMFDREGALTQEEFEGSGADWLDSYKKYIDGENVIVTSPHKIYGPESNDLALQLRKHGFNKVVLAGMSANLCTESHMRDLVESGFNVSVVKDATAAAILPGMNGYEAALVNFRMIASHVFTTEEIVAELKKINKVE
jgi:nicotinamidase-related amidase